MCLFDVNPFRSVIFNLSFRADFRRFFIGNKMVDIIRFLYITVRCKRSTDASPKHFYLHLSLKLLFAYWIAPVFYRTYLANCGRPSVFLPFPYHYLSIFKCHAKKLHDYFYHLFTNLIFLINFHFPSYPGRRRHFILHQLLRCCPVPGRCPFPFQCGGYLNDNLIHPLFYHSRNLKPVCGRHLHPGAYPVYENLHPFISIADRQDCSCRTLQLDFVFVAHPS